MTKLKIIPFCEDQKDYSKALQNYWNIANPEKIEQMKVDIFNHSKNLHQRKEAYQRNKKTISLLRSAFKELIIAHNKVAKNRGYKVIKIIGSMPQRLKVFLPKKLTGFLKM